MATMTEEAKAKRAAYMRQWRAKNPEKVKEANARYWMRKCEQTEQGETWDKQRSENAS